jgi:L-fuconolactonase
VESTARGLPGSDEAVIDPQLEITDSHHHLWDHRDPPYLLDDLLEDCDSGHRVTKTVFVECLWGWDEEPRSPQLAPVGEVRRAAAVAEESRRRASNAIAAIVAFADLRHGAAVGEVLDELVSAGAGLVVGIRQTSAWDPSPAISAHPTRPEPGMLADPAFLEGFRQLAARGLTYDAWLYHTQLEELAALAACFPGVSIVVNHLGGPLDIGPYAGAAEEVRARWEHGLRRLAACPNVYLKLGGIGMPKLAGDRPSAAAPTSWTIADRWRDQARSCIDLFGVERCMFESNFPVDKPYCSYRVLWNAFKLMVEDGSADDKSWLFRRTADRVYRLDR